MSPGERPRYIADPVPACNATALQAFPELCAELGKVGGREPARLVAAGSGSGAGRAPWLRFLRGVVSSTMGDVELLPLSRCCDAAAACAVAAPILDVVYAPGTPAMPAEEAEGKEEAPPKITGIP